MNHALTPQTSWRISTLAATLLGFVLSLIPTAARSASVLVPSGAPFRVGVVGLAHPHAGAVLHMLARPDVQIVGISEPDKERAAQFIKRGLPRDLVFADEAEMIEKTHPQAVVIYSSTYDHLRDVEVAARHGVHVMMEKPLAVSMEHARGMARAAREGNIHVLVNFVTTWYSSNAMAKALLHDQSLGAARKIVVHAGHNKPRELTGPEGWIVDPKLNGGGALFDFGCYGAILATWLMDGRRPISVMAVTQTFKPDLFPRVDDEATIILTYPKAQAILQASWNWPFDRKDMEVYGENGYAFTVGVDSVRVRKPGREEQLIEAPALGPPQNDPLAYLKAVVVDGLKPTGMSSLEDNVIATEILEAARESDRSGKRIDLPAVSIVAARQQP